MKTLMYAICGALMIGCATGPKVISDGKWPEVKARAGSSVVTLYVSDVDIECRIVDVSASELTIERNGKQEKLPSDAVNRVVVPYAGNKSSARWIGAGVGFVVGSAVGYAVGNAASDESGAKVIAHPLSLLSMLGLTAGGAVIGGNFTRDEAVDVHREPMRFTLDIEVGDAITPLELNSFGLFQDVKVGEGEKIIQVQVFTLGQDRYLLLYDVATTTGYDVRWTVVSSSYLAAQKAKIKG